MSARRPGLWLAILGLALGWLLAACVDTPPPPPQTDADTWFVEVEGEGGIWLRPETLGALGLDPQQEEAPTLRLSWRDHEVPYQPVSTEEGWGLWFFAPNRATRYTQRTAFRLEKDASGSLISSEAAPNPSGAPVDGLATVRWEQDHRYLPQAEAELPWFWEPLAAPGSLKHTLILTDSVPGPITITLNLWSHSASQAEPDHLLRLLWDGQLVAEWTWDGEGMKHLTASWHVNGASESSAAHTLTIEVPGLSDTDLEVIWLDGWDVTYPRPVEAGGTIRQATGTALHVREGKPDLHLFDVSEPFAPVNLGPVPDGQDTSSIVGTLPGHRYWLGVLEESPAPLVVRPASQVDLEALATAKYLAIAPSQFQPPLEPLLKHRRAQGLEAAVVDPQAVYDTFGSGRPDPEAIRTLVQNLPSLRYLLLVGDGTSELEGYDGQAGALRVVVPMTRTEILGETPADGLLRSEPVAVGRFPAISQDDVATMVDKTLAWENRQNAPATLILSDDEADFSAMAQEVLSLASEPNQIEWLDAGEDGSREAVLAALRREATVLNFIGHGSPTLLCDEGILTIEDGESWRQPAVVVAWSCLAAHFVHPLKASMGEVWMRSPRGGTVAFLGPVGETTPAEQKPFLLAFYEALQREERLGDAWRVALQTDGPRDVAVGYVLLGDPALKLSGD